MHPKLFFFGFEIPAYTLFSILALVVVAFGGYFFALSRGFSKRDAFLMVFFMSISTFLGARILNFFVNYSYYENNFFKIFEFSTRGFSLYGGVLGAVLSGLIVSYKRKINLMRFADSMTPFVGIGIVLMRIGCFLNGCCFGKETDSIFGVVFPKFSLAHIHQLNGSVFGSATVRAVHPTQLYELFFALICVIFAFYALKRKFKDGTVFLICGALFSAFRWVNMYFRELNYPDYVLKFVYPSIYLSIIVFCLFLFFRINNSFKRKLFKFF
ncbi:MAG: prolipoprotein diacylglyceryl transferase [Candidatus Gracilibacteria bacterium]|jgi:phosphatidylglycerol:prolipoprotein diacylglycerol transferase|nr:prolipoprotein diacylglyceryl transferase [Candidatus Gracilibacteria bacterium]